MIGVRTIARPLLASMFIYGGLDQLRAPAKKVERARQSPMVLPKIEQLGLTEDEDVVRANGGVMVVAGLALATGKFPRVAATVLAASLAPTTLAGHPFWIESDPDAKKANLVQTLKNLSMLGGLLLAAVDHEGKGSLTHRAGHLAHETAQSGRLLKKDAQLKAVKAGGRVAKHSLT